MIKFMFITVIGVCLIMEAGIRRVRDDFEAGLKRVERMGR